MAEDHPWTAHRRLVLHELACCTSATNGLGWQSDACRSGRTTRVPRMREADRRTVAVARAMVQVQADV
jgi:hypothetical protein